MLGQAVAGSSDYANRVSLSIVELRADLSIQLTHYSWHGNSGDPMNIVAAELGRRPRQPEGVSGRRSVHRPR